MVSHQGFGDIAAMLEAEGSDAGGKAKFYLSLRLLFCPNRLGSCYKTPTQSVRKVGKLDPQQIPTFSHCQNFCNFQ